MVSLRLTSTAIAAALATASCGGGDGPASSPQSGSPQAGPARAFAMVAPEEPRVQDTRSFPLDPAFSTDTFAPMEWKSPRPPVPTSRWAGVLGGAGYFIEVPDNWNGKLVMYAHGFVPGEASGRPTPLKVTPPTIRRHLIEQGYAWAASSYTKNFYDVRAGVEDTNALALAFGDIARDRGRALPPPSRIYIVGHSMGGHVAAAAVEAETLATANHKVRYAGAVPMCGVVGDTALFDFMAAAQITAQALAGFAQFPLDKWDSIQGPVVAALTSPLLQQGQKYKSVIQNLSGGPRPMFEAGFNAPFSSFLGSWVNFGKAGGTVDGILTKNPVDTNRFTYVIDNNPQASAMLNAVVQKLTAAPDANRLRRDGLRWVPKVNGEFSVPVVTLHTLGDLFVPFSMEQIYQERAAAKGSAQWLVQRAIRGVSHCDFTIQEQVEAFEAMVRWESDGLKPEGDDVMTPSIVADRRYGCRFTRNGTGADDLPLIVLGNRLLQARLQPCPSP